jgi:hypothetical protein
VSVDQLTVSRLLGEFLWNLPGCNKQLSEVWLFVSVLTHCYIKMAGMIFMSLVKSGSQDRCSSFHISVGKAKPSDLVTVHGPV